MCVPTFGVENETQSGTDLRKTASFSAFLEFVPSLSWQNDHFRHKTAQKEGVFLTSPNRKRTPAAAATLQQQ